ncbi:Nucleotide-binding universal stress protein, UspA family [Mariniphaga anaerophila]|uniref:Nucleotide-binding universal stress protein, UspA family n=1 Tax=Mariniphaga anaerophila TaxID=1484053 RepID=A0A1M4W0A3_9BACT|nr:universal stress protein [Mariniphaga anaerophila]SHE74627.1 Nucleotide-binding universal stress protein, UspA family [Mariniphaga anaerophila]
MRYRSNNILTLIPPTEEGKSILQQALFFRQHLGMRLFIYNIIDKPSFLKKLIAPKKLKNRKHDYQNTLQNFVEGITDTENLQHITYRIKEGSPLPVLLKQSKNCGYEFLIVGKNENNSGMDADDLDKLISRSCCPVMAFEPGHQIKKINKIVIPVDISQSTKKKLLWATYFAKKFNAKITVVSALGINIKTKQSLAWRNAEKLKYMLVQRGIKCEVKILRASGQQKHVAILDYIEKENPGMVILRTHQESSLTGVEIGKFVSEIIHGCKMPVFTVTRFMDSIPVDFDL